METFGIQDDVEFTVVEFEDIAFAKRAGDDFHEDASLFERIGWPGPGGSGWPPCLDAPCLGAPCRGATY
jgi:hypothetical protein